jgi:hypothetical protein
MVTMSLLGEGLGDGEDAVGEGEVDGGGLADGTARGAGLPVSAMIVPMITTRRRAMRATRGHVHRFRRLVAMGEVVDAFSVGVAVVSRRVAWVA